MTSPARTPEILLGADVGATRARVRVRAAEEGPDLAAVEGPGFNVNSTGADALDGLVRAVREALAAAGAADRPARVRAVLGIAGAGPAHHAHVQQVVGEALAPWIGDVRVTDDQITAFAAGSTTGTGLLLLGGTGSAAVRYERLVPVRRSDGMGWLLGDTGSGVWIGRAVLQAVAADLDARGPRTAMTADVLARLGIAPGSPGGGDPRQALIAAVRPLAPAQWGRFAPVPGEHPDDAVARGILEEAARELVAKVDAVRSGEAGEEVVLVGSVLTRGALVAGSVRAALAERGLVIRAAADPVQGAFRLAGRPRGIS